MWSTTPGTTDPYFPFGVTQLAGYSSEGFPWNSGAFRLAQTGGYGYMPNKAIPNSFLGQAFGAIIPTIASPLSLFQRQDLGLKMICWCVGRLG